MSGPQRFAFDGGDDALNESAAAIAGHENVLAALGSEPLHGPVRTAPLGWNDTLGPKQSRSTSLTLAEEALIVAFRKQTLLPLEDCLYALQATLPHLTRSALHHCLQRHGISRLLDMAGEQPARKQFKSYPIGYFHLDIAEVRTEEGKLSLFVAIARACKFAYAELHAEANKTVAAQFLRNLMAAIPYKIHTVLTDHGIQFTNRKRDIYAFSIASIASARSMASTIG